MSDPRKILLVEDEPSVRVTIAALLEDEGYQVVDAISLDQARRRMLEHHFDCAILDRSVGAGLGTDLVPELREKFPEIRILVVSGSPRLEVGGVDAIFDKVTSPREILDTVAQLLQQR